MRIHTMFGLRDLYHMPEETLLVKPIHHNQKYLIIAGVFSLVVLIALYYVWSNYFYIQEFDENGQWTPEKKEAVLEQLNAEAKKAGVVELSSEEKMKIMEKENLKHAAP